MLRAWMEEWLLALKWHCTIGMDPWISLDDIINNAPIMQVHWKATRKDENLIRFGLQWACYDLVSSLGLDFALAALPSYDVPLGGIYIIGGRDVISWSLWKDWKPSNETAVVNLVGFHC